MKNFLIALTLLASVVSFAKSTEYTCVYIGDASELEGTNYAEKYFVSAQGSLLTVQDSQTATSYKGKFDSLYKPTMNKDYFRYLGFSGLNPIEYILVTKNLVNGKGGSGAMKITHRDTYHGELQSFFYKCKED